MGPLSIHQRRPCGLPGETGRSPSPAPPPPTPAAAATAAAGAAPAPAASAAAAGRAAAVAADSDEGRREVGVHALAERCTAGLEDRLKTPQFKSYESNRKQSCLTVRLTFISFQKIVGIPSGLRVQNNIGR
jgi:hypothetical protein